MVRLRYLGWAGHVPKAAFAIVLALGVAILGLPATAGACSCEGPCNCPPAIVLDAHFVGRAVGYTPHPAGSTFEDARVIEWTFAVHAMEFGRRSPILKVFAEKQEERCGFVPRADVRYRIGAWKQHGVLWTDGCSGNEALDPEPEGAALLPPHLEAAGFDLHLGQTEMAGIGLVGAAFLAMILGGRRRRRTLAGTISPVGE